MDGVVVIDKPAGISSFRAVKDVRRIFRVARAGHTGTLDPMATGVLTVCLGRCTRLSRFIMHGRKSYVVVMKLGVSTDTFDSEGKVIEERPLSDSIDIKKITDVMGRFTGKIMQNPPVFSALKHNGVPLYKLARKGRAVQKPARQIEIFNMEIHSIDLPYVKFSVDCSEGTYIRALVNDIGHELGCGACMTSLRRTANGIFTLQDAVTLQDLEDAAEKNMLDSMLIAPARALGHLASAQVSPDDAEHLRHGRPVSAAKIMRSIKGRGIALADMPYVIIETLSDGLSEFVAVAKKPSSEDERIETLKVWN